MVTAFLSVNHDLALVARRPALFLGLLQECLQLLILGTFQRRMPDPIASNTDLGTTAPTLSPRTTLVRLNIRGVNPITASLVGAVESVLGGVLFVLAIPLLLELHVEVMFDMTQGDALGAAAGWHFFGVFERHLEGPDDAVTAHVVIALECVCLVRLECVTAGYTLDPVVR